MGLYFDYAATTPVDERVVTEMLPYFNDKFGNASSMHTYGTAVKEVLTDCRSKMAGFINSKPDELIFTSSGTESNNAVLKGIAFANRNKGHHIIVSAIEHDCIIETCRWLETQGFFITYLPVDKNGFVDVENLVKFITPKTILVSVMHANNEIGTIEPIEEIGKICRHKQVYFHTDACQTYGKIPIDVQKLYLDSLTFSSHKIYGPKGVAALYVRKGVNTIPLLHGGGQEFGLRAATENIAGIVGFTKAAELCIESINEESERISVLQRKLMSELEENFPNIYFNGDLKQRLVSNVNFCLSGMEGETIRLLLLLSEQNIAVSTGSACSANHTSSASHVLQAIGLNPFEARGSIRVSIGRYTNEADINHFIGSLKKCVNKLNSIFTN